MTVTLGQLYVAPKSGINSVETRVYIYIKEGSYEFHDKRLYFDINHNFEVVDCAADKPVL